MKDCITILIVGLIIAFTNSQTHPERSKILTHIREVLKSQGPYFTSSTIDGTVISYIYEQGLTDSLVIRKQVRRIPAGTTKQEKWIDYMAIAINDLGKVEILDGESVRIIIRPSAGRKVCTRTAASSKLHCQTASTLTLHFIGSSTSPALRSLMADLNAIAAQNKQARR